MGDVTGYMFLKRELFSYCIDDRDGGYRRGLWNIRVYLGISTEVIDDGELDWDDGRGERGVDWFWKDRGQGSQ